MRYGTEGYPWVSPQQYEEAKNVAGELADLAHDVPTDVSVSYKAPRPESNFHARRSSKRRAGLLAPCSLQNRLLQGGDAGRMRADAHHVDGIVLNGVMQTIAAADLVLPEALELPAHRELPLSIRLERTRREPFVRGNRVFRQPFAYGCPLALHNGRTRFERENAGTSGTPRWREWSTTRHAPR